ncbi:hypothetical protein R5R35_008563 [Gryllus longicercus]|uniref:Uncharacterized protein n=1 Tax=Gryllus longicercus TaxID=2509291 RepID=A0AAN9V5W0_9ORTH
MRLAEAQLGARRAAAQVVTAKWTLARAAATVLLAANGREIRLMATSRGSGCGGFHLAQPPGSDFRRGRRPVQCSAVLLCAGRHARAPTAAAAARRYVPHPPCDSTCWTQGGAAGEGERSFDTQSAPARCPRTCEVIEIGHRGRLAKDAAQRSF